MARIQKDIVNYFPHDANASAGDTLTVLQGRFGNDGYAFWFKLLEKLASTNGHYIDCRNLTKFQVFLAKMGVDELLGVEILNLLVEMQAIDKDLWESKLIWCQNLVDNVADVYKNRRREIPQKPVITNSNPITTEGNGITTSSHPVEIPQSKLKESKVNKNKVNNIKVSSSPSHLEDNQVNNLSDEMAEIATMYEAEIGKITSFVAQELNDTLQNYPADKIKDAIKEAVKQNKRKWNYVKGILKNWKESGHQGGKDKPERDYSRQKINYADPDKYIKGKYGHMVRR